MKSGDKEISIEKQLLCPQCTNERLDICSIQICIDMRKEIREYCFTNFDWSSIIKQYKEIINSI